jgi:hypothetical protein
LCRCWDPQSISGDDVDNSFWWKGRDHQNRNCCLARESQYDLGSAAVVCVAATVGSFFLRVFFNALIRWLKRRKGEEYDHEVLPFPVWELQVFLICFTGLAESAGVAIASGCLVYEIAGAAVLLFLLLVLAFLAAFVFIAVHSKTLFWSPIKWKDARAKAKEEFAARKDGRTWAHWFNQVYLAYLALDHRGEWDVDDETPQAKVLGHRFMERMGGAFDSYQGSSFWMGFWSLLRAIIVCLVLAMVFNSTANAIIVLVVQSVDYALIWLMFPESQWFQFLLNAYKASINLSILGSILAYTQGILPDEIFTVLFQILAVVSVLVRPFQTCTLLCPTVHRDEGFCDEAKSYDHQRHN